MDRTRTPACPEQAAPIALGTTDSSGTRDVWTRVSGRYTHPATSVLATLDELLELRADGVEVTPITLPPAPAAPAHSPVALLTVDEEGDRDVWLREGKKYVSMTLQVACDVDELVENGYRVTPLVPATGSEAEQSGGAR